MICFKRVQFFFRAFTLVFFCELCVLKKVGYSRVFGIKDGLNSNLLNSVVEDSEGNIWILSQNKNLSKYDGVNFTSFPELNGTMSLGGQLSIDKWQNMWVLAFGAGAGVNNVLYRKPKNEKTFREYKQPNLGNLPATTLLLTHTTDFETYLNHRKKVYMFNGKQFGEVIYPKTQNGSSFLDNKNLLLAHKDHNESHWIWATEPITGRTDLVSFDTKTKEYEKIEFPQSKIPAGANINRGWQVYVASDDKIYVVAHPINMIFIFDKNRNFLTTYGAANGFIGIMAASGTIFEDKYGSIWVGTRGNGVIQLPNERFTNFTPQDGTQGKMIFGFGEDAKNRVWLGSSVGGITLYKDKTFQTVVPSLSPFGRISAF